MGIRTQELPALAHCLNRPRHRVPHVTRYTRFQNDVLIKQNNLTRQKENLKHNNLYLFYWLIKPIVKFYCYFICLKKKHVYSPLFPPLYC